MLFTDHMMSLCSSGTAGKVCRIQLLKRVLRMSVLQQLYHDCLNKSVSARTWGAPSSRITAIFLPLNIVLVSFAQLCI